MKTARFQHWGRMAPLAVGAAMVLAAGAGAQEPERVPEQDRDQDNCICFDRPTEGRMGSVFLWSNRARIGVFLGGTEEVNGQTGVRIEDVVEDGPAESAGLEAGDVITALNGDPLGDDPTEGLIDALGDVEPGDEVTLTYYRDGDRRTAEVTTDEDVGSRAWRLREEFTPRAGFDVRVAPRVHAGELEGRIRDMRVITPRLMLRQLAGGLEMAELNPGLGTYFGADEGVLVLEIDDDSSLGLRPGDVILAIDGRDVRDPAHVRAILDSYRADEDVSFRIIRERREMDVTGTIGG